MLKKTMFIFSIGLMGLMTTSSFANNHLELITNNVDEDYKQTAISLMENSSVQNIELINKRVVISLNTSGKYFEVKVANGSDSFTKKQSLGVVKIPFPKSGDLTECFQGQKCPTLEYRDILLSYGIRQTASETMNDGNMEFYFKTIKYRSLLKADQNIHIGFILTPVRSSFDQSNPLHFFKNGCDNSGCWGGYGISLNLLQK